MSAYNTTIEWARESRIRTLAQLEMSSTNTEAKAHLETLGHRSLVIADHQTSGRGRGTHTWQDSSGQALLSSWIFLLEKSPQPITSALVGLALYESARKAWPALAWALRAPNDIHIITPAKNAQKDGQADGKTENAKKIAGILIEMISMQAPTKPTDPQVAVIVGVGMNVNGAPSDVTPYAATSLSSELVEHGQTLTDSDWRQFLSIWIETCEKLLHQGTQAELSRESRTRLVAALKRHPDYREIDDVEADGSITFKNGRKVLWTEL